MQAGWPTSEQSDLGAEASPFVPPDKDILQELFPQLEVLELIGRGGMGAVYKARQPNLDRLVALKILAKKTDRDPDFGERFTREARALAKLSHPNIVAVHDYGQAKDLSYFIMEYVDGPNLREIQKSGQLSPKEALGIVPQICMALQYAHDEGIVHRDIKPENILLDRKGHVKIADFGLAKLLGKERSNFTLTQDNQVMGTPHYMAPEQVEHPQDVDHRADIYSLGVVFYEMLTGELPLGKFAPPSRKVQIDVRLDEVVLRTLEKEPQRRYQQASQVSTEVQTIVTSPDKGSLTVIKSSNVEEYSSLTQPEIWEIRGRLQTVGFWIFIVGLMEIGFIATILYIKWMDMNRDVVFIPALGLCVLPLMVLMGASYMRRLKHYGLAVTSAFLAMVCPVGLPFGIWALVILNQKEVRQAFAANSRRRKKNAPQRHMSPSSTKGCFEYRSRRTLWGLPLVHVTCGIDPATGRPRLAQGIVAIGDRARGVIAFGGVAVGVVAFGGVSAGLLSFGGGSMGLLMAIGGLAVGGVALGGGAIGWIAMGGLAVGHLAYGGGAWGLHAWGSNYHDPVAQEFFDHPWARAVMAKNYWLLLWIPLCIFGVVGIVLPSWLETRIRPVGDWKRRLWAWLLWTNMVIVILSILIIPYMIRRHPYNAGAKIEAAVKAVKDYGGFIKQDSQGRITEVNLVYDEDEQDNRRECNNTSDEIAAVLPAFPNLEVLSLMRTQATDNAMRAVGQIRSLRELHMWDAEITDQGVASLRDLRNLEELHISDAGIGDASLKAMSQLPSLQFLSLQGNRFTDKGLAYLTRMKQLKKLWIGLGHGRITDAGLQSLADLTHLEELELQGYEITDSGLEHLHGLKRLRTIYLGQTQVTEEGKRGLKQAIGGLEIR